jgi:putative spermidine/putrescine transport system permease protein
MPQRRATALLSVAPALAMVLALFVYPLGLSLVSAFTTKDGHPTFANFAKTFDLYDADIVFTVLIVAISTALTGILAAVHSVHCRRAMHADVSCKKRHVEQRARHAGLVDIASLSGLLDWRGIIVTFVWKETPFVALLVSGAMASLDRAGIEAARNLRAGGLRILAEILLPQVAGVMAVGLVLAFVTMLSVLSVPIMISGGSPTMITVDMAFRVNSYSDYGVANALGFISYLIAGSAAWLYLRRAATEAAR